MRGISLSMSMIYLVIATVAEGARTQSPTAALTIVFVGLIAIVLADDICTAIRERK